MNFSVFSRDVNLTLDEFFFDGVWEEDIVKTKTFFKLSLYFHWLLYYHKKIILTMSNAIKLTDIEWAYSIQVDPSISVIDGFIKNLSLFVGEIIRSDEIGLIVWGQQPIFMVRIYKIDLENKGNYVEIITFQNSGMKGMLTSLGLTNHNSDIICSGFEIFCYRPKPDHPYHPRMYPTYNRAREKASRILDTVLIVLKAPDMSSVFSYAKVNTQSSIKFFKNLAEQDKHTEERVINLATLIDCWTQEFYSKEIDSKQYKTKNRYPLSPQPLEDCKLVVLTTDDDDKFITYEVDI